MKVWISGSIVSTFDELVEMSEEDYKILSEAPSDITSYKEAFGIVLDYISTPDPEEITNFGCWRNDD